MIREPITPYADPYLYRRQFLAGPRFCSLPGWTRTTVDATFRITSHPDLEVHQAARGGVSLTLLGFICDPSSHLSDSRTILEKLAAEAETFERLLAALGPYGGRWIVIWKKAGAIRLAHDPFGMRSVCYAKRSGIVWCASTPFLLGAVLGLHPREQGNAGLAGNGGIRPGDETEYPEVRQLLPNHALNVRNGETARYWPACALEPLPPEAAAEKAAMLLQGTLLAAAARRPLMLPVTSGWSSRLLLAASRPLVRYVKYYYAARRDFDDNDPDLVVPRMLAARLGFRLDRLACGMKPEEAYVYYRNRNNGPGASDREEAVAYGHFRSSQGRLNVTGAGGKLVREPYLKIRSELSIGQLAERSGFGSVPGALEAFGRWAQGAGEASDRSGIPLELLFYWEMDGIRRAASSTARLDIAVEEIAPFNNRLLLETMLAVPPEHRTEPDCRLLRAMIGRMWPDSLEAPMNPKVSHQAKVLCYDLIRSGLKAGRKLSLAFGFLRD
ncbi:hypothetical protein ACFQWB_13560 [Paenibacillus thermoaerophilus]|uniref:Glutamine amidotransferase type-2 domain-containing protein n=1 Tax=Paenibacillus thermoaerophilus TaxID=1215385 RepID=A0ABW2V4A4_9BACL|nr:hypothetical protein [Paenibacillus thermoaerophilus]TMV16147.1 hypothetical protein FE781_08760 [Paenibacillus thermoaerophilus]